MESQISEIIENLREVRNTMRIKKELKVSSPAESMLSATSDITKQFSLYDSITPRTQVTSPNSEPLQPFDFPSSRSDLLKTNNRA